jgi:hypothetical protein
MKRSSTSSSASGSVSADRALTVTATDDASGVAVREYRLDGGQWLAWTSAVQLDGAAHTIAVRASDVAGNTSPAQTLSVDATPAPTPAAPAATMPPSVAGAPAVGRTLVATTGSWDQDGLTFAYQWLRDGVPVPGATSASLLLGAADVGHRLSVQVMASRAGGPVGAAQSASSSPVVKAPSRVRVSLDRTPAPGSSTKVTVRVPVTPASVEATGRVTVRVDGTVVRRVRLSDAKAMLRLSFTPGRHLVTVSYAGSDSVAASTKKVRVRVRARR